MYRISRLVNRVTHLVLIVASLLMVFPFVWQIVMSLATNAQVTSVPPTFWPGTLHVENFAKVFGQLPFLDQLWVSTAVTVIRTVGQLLLCSMAGYAFARMDFPLKRTIFALVLAILMVPPQVYLLPQYQIVQGLGWLNTIAGIAAPGIFSAFGTFLMRQFFLGLPDELSEAARLDGANHFQVFWKVMLPLAKPGLSALAIITVLASWNDLLWPLIVATDSTQMPLAPGIATLTSQRSIPDYPLLLAASLLAMAPVLLLFLFMQRRVIDGIAFSGMK
ncbi:ABC transporter permease [Leifsonia xyli subsp. cynodontis DSM 46306]|uniref:ABC transmembrane type-1 domain-containing protein n=1 Tax=Leifsonia xyli subsp. cynodontis DSM 46306 TaxID=1389489 RepID=U3PE39_LEIXC|nr:carbohydrate ABC transporter permease [Leifsonia xyli]AGW41833.1 ABC transporter permease [Leifsonia xyli subsp. cynodontis DSM 46306]